MGHFYLFTAAFVAILFLSRLIRNLSAADALKSLPTFRVPFQPLAFPAAILPTTWWNLGATCTWTWRKHIYANSEHIAVLPFITGVPLIYTSNLDAARQVLATGNKATFIKPLSTSGPLMLWGMNILATEGGEMWRTHRRIAAPAFNNKAYQLVWQTTAKLYNEMIEHEGWLKRNIVDVPDPRNYTTKFALLTVAAAAFGMPFKWDAPPTAEDGSMFIQEAFTILTSSLLLCTMLPKWAWNIPLQSLREFRAAHHVVAQWLRTTISERKSALKDNALGEHQEFRDVLSMLVQANEMEAKLKLDDDELLGNSFAFLVAGHETFAWTMVATLVHLALHPDIQEDVFLQILDLVGDREPTFEDYYKLTKVLAVFHETNRLFPGAYISIREATEDCVLTLPNPMGKEGSETVPIAKGSRVAVDWVGIQRNPRYFHDPLEFKPSRWDKSNEDSVLGFGAGPRACIGRRFAETEAVCLLTYLLKSWRVEPWLQNGEDLMDWKERTLNSGVSMGLVMSVGPAPLRFVARVSV